MSEIEFVKGLIVKPPRDGAPDYVKGSISIKRKELGNYLRGKTGDWINIDVRVSKGGKWYAAVNDWKPDGEKKPGPAPGKEQGADPEFQGDDFDEEKIPF